MLEKQNRFSIRKLTVGVASVTIGFWLAGSGNVAHADVVDGNASQTEVKTDNTLVDKKVAQSTNTDTEQDAKNQTNNSDVVKSTDTKFVKLEQEKDQTQTDVVNSSTQAGITDPAINRTSPIDIANVAKSSSVSKDASNQSLVVANDKTNLVNDTLSNSMQRSKQLDNTSVKTNVLNQVTTDTHYVGSQHIKIDDAFKDAFPKSFTVDDSLKYKDLADQQFKNNTYQSDPVAKTEPVDVYNLTDSQLTRINKYTTDIVNKLRHDVGIDKTEDYKINTDLMKWQQNQTKKQAELNMWGHNAEYLHGAGENVGALPIDNTTGRSISELKPSDFNFTYDPNAKTVTTWSPAIAVKTMDDLYAFSYYMTSIFMFEDYGGEANSHAENFTFANRGPKQYSELGIYPATNPKTKKTNLFFRWIVPNVDTFNAANVDGNKNNISADPGPVNKQVIHLIDDTDQNNKLNDIVISNPAGTVLNTEIKAPVNYVLAENYTLPSTFDFTNGDLPDLTVHVKHNIETVNDTRNNATETIKIHYVDNKGNKLKDDTTVKFTFHRDYTIDKATGKSTIGHWEYVPNSMTQSGTYIKDIGEPGKHYNSVDGYDSFNFWIPFNVDVDGYSQKYSGLTASFSIPNGPEYLFDGNLNVDQNIVYESTRKGYISNLKPDDVLNIQDDDHANTTGDFIVNLQLPDKYKSLIPESKTTFHIQFHRLYGTDKISGEAVWGPWQFVLNTADGFGSNYPDIGKLTVRDSLSVDDFTNDIYFDPNESSKESHYDVFKLTDGSLKSQIAGLIPYFKNMGLGSYATMKIPNDNNHPSKVTVTLNEAVGVDETIKHPLNIQVKDRATNQILYQTSMNVLINGTTLSSDDIQKVNGYTYEPSAYNPVDMFDGQGLPDWVILADKDKAKNFTINIYDDDLDTNGKSIGVVGTINPTTASGYATVAYKWPNNAKASLADYIISQIPDLPDKVTIAGDYWKTLKVGDDATSLSNPNWRISDFDTVRGKTFTIHIKSAYSSVMYNFIDTVTNQVVGKYNLGKVKAGADITIDKDQFKRAMPDHYYLDRNYDIPNNIVAAEPTMVINVPVHKAYVCTITFYDETAKKVYDTRFWRDADSNGNLTWDGIDDDKHLTGTINAVNTWVDNQIDKLVYDTSDNDLSKVDITKLPPVATLGDISWYDKDADMDHMITKDESGRISPFTSLPEQDAEITVPFTHNFVDLKGYAPIFTPSSVYAENDENLKDFIKTLNSADSNDPREWTRYGLDKLKVKWTSGGTLGGTLNAGKSAFSWGSGGGLLISPTYQLPAVSHIDKYLQNSVTTHNLNVNDRPSGLDPTVDVAFGRPYMIPMSTKNYDLFDRKASESIHFDLSDVLSAVSEKHNGYHVEVLTVVCDKTTNRTKWELIPVNNTNVRDETSIFDLLNKELNVTFGKTLDKSKIPSLSDVDGALLNAIGGDNIRPNVNNIDIEIVPTNTGRYEYRLTSSVDGLFYLVSMHTLENPTIDELVPYTSVMYREALKKAAKQSNMSDYEYVGNTAYMNPSVMLYTVAPNDETATIKYIDDDTGETLKQDTTNGKFDSVISFTTDPSAVITNYEKQGYKVVSNTYKSGAKFNLSNSFEVHLTKKIDNTINYVDENGKTVKTDKVTDIPGSNIKLNIPDGYHIEGNLPKLTINSKTPVQTVNVIENKHETGVPETNDKDVLNVVNYVDSNGKIVKTDKVVGEPNNKIDITIPDGYHIDGDMPSLVIDSHEPIQTVNVIENKHETDEPLVNDKPEYDLDKLKKHETGDPLVSEKPAYDLDKLKKHETDEPLVDNKPAFDLDKLKKHETGKPLTDNKPAFDLDKLKKHETGEPLTDNKPAYDLDKLKKHETDEPLVDNKPAFDLDKLKKHETGKPLTDNKPAFDLDKLKKHETGEPLVDNKPAFDLDKLKKHETGEPLTDNKPAFDLDKLKKHETDEPLVDNKPAFDLDKLKKHETGEPLVDNKPAFDLDKLKKHETGKPLTDNKPAFDLDKLKKHEANEFLVDEKPVFIPIQTRQMRTQAQVRKLVQSDNGQHYASDMKKPTESHARKLPQAGAKQSLVPIILGVISTMLAGLGLTKRKKNK